MRFILFLLLAFALGGPVWAATDAPAGGNEPAGKNGAGDAGKSDEAPENEPARTAMAEVAKSLGIEISKDTEVKPYDHSFTTDAGYEVTIVAYVEVKGKDGKPEYFGYSKTGDVYRTRDLGAGGPCFD